MLRKTKEHERLVIRNNSIRYDETISKNRRNDKNTKEGMVRQARKNKENYKLGLEDSRLEE